MKNFNKGKILVSIFYILFGLNILIDGVIFYDFFDPCRIDMIKCGESFTFSLVHASYFIKIVGIINLINVIFCIYYIYRNIRLKKIFYIILSFISILLTFSVWLLFIGELGIIFS